MLSEMKLNLKEMEPQEVNSGVAPMRKSTPSNQQSRCNGPWVSGLRLFLRFKTIIYSRKQDNSDYSTVEASSHTAYRHPKVEMRSLRQHCHSLPVLHFQNPFLIDLSEETIHALGFLASRILVFVPHIRILATLS